jgi:hypothetical protein
VASILPDELEHESAAVFCLPYPHVPQHLFPVLSGIIAAYIARNSGV